MNKQRELRRKRIAKARTTHRKMRGTANKPRLSVFRSARHIYCQVIDDEAGRTLCAASSVKLNETPETGGDETTKRAIAAAVGKEIASKLAGQGIEMVVFDRGWYRYHGRIKALADAARKAGLKF